jgi:hypothetical protein
MEIFNLLQPVKDLFNATSVLMTKNPIDFIRTAIVLSTAGLCFSGSFTATQYLPTVQAQTQASTPQPSIEDLNIKIAQLSSSNKS